MTSLSVHPLSPNYLSLGLGDGTVCLMDRRVTGYNGPEASHQTPTLLGTKACVTRFKPESLSKKPFKITSLQFNETGSELLVNYSEDYLYLFSSSLIGCGGDINTRIGRPSSSRYTASRSETRRKENTLSSSASSKSNFTPPTKRLRLRGDWSDTGPDARPENTQERNEEEREGEGGESESRGGRSTFMNRMSHLFARWIDESLSSNSSNPTSVPSTGGTVSSTGDGEVSSVHSEDSSFQLFSDEESDEESSMSDPKTPTASLTTAMASCSTDSPHKARPGVSTSDRGREEEEERGEKRRGREKEEEPNKRGRGQSYTRARQVTQSASDGLTSPLRVRTLKEEKEEEDHEVSPDPGRENTDGGSVVNDVSTGAARVSRGGRSRIQLVEGESDSDDLREEERDFCSTNDEIEDEGEERHLRVIKSNNQPLMMYQGHRNARTMVS